MVGISDPQIDVVGFENVCCRSFGQFRSPLDEFVRIICTARFEVNGTARLSYC